MSRRGNDTPPAYLDRVSPGQIELGWRIIAIAMLGYFAVSSVRLMSGPGLGADEVLFVDGAVPGHGQYLAKHVFGIPFLLMSYIGALKSYLYYPIFALAGVSTTTIRLPAILMGAAAILLLAAAARRFVSLPASTAFLSLMATDPGYIMGATVDFGPIVLMMLLKGLAFWLVASLVMAPRPWHLPTLVVVLSLGVFDKLNFLWLVFALGAATLLFCWRPFLGLLRRRPVLNGAFLIAFSVVIAVALMQAAASLAQMPDELRGPVEYGWLHKVAPTSSAYLRTMSGLEFYHHVVEERSPYATLTSLGLLVAIIACCLALRGMFAGHNGERGDRLTRAISFTACLALILFAEICLIRRAGGPHHLMLLWPLHHFLTVAGAILLTRPWRSRRLGVIAAAVLPVVIVVSQVVCTEAQLARIHQRRCFRDSFSREITDLASYLEEAKSFDAIVVVDWGAGPQLRSLASAKQLTKLNDLWYDFLGMDRQATARRQQFERHYLAGKNVLAVFTSAGFKLNSSCRENFVDLLKQSSRTMRPMKTFHNAEGRAVYAVVAIP